MQYRTYKTKEEELSMLEALLDEFIREGIGPGSITVLSPYKKENSVVADMRRHKVRDYNPTLEDVITFSTIQAYKGLENSIIILTDVDTFVHEKLMYVGLSRARSGLYIFETEDAEKEHIQLMLKAVSK